MLCCAVVGLGAELLKPAAMGEQSELSPPARPLAYDPLDLLSMEP